MPSRRPPMACLVALGLAIIPFLHACSDSDEKLDRSLIPELKSSVIAAYDVGSGVISPFKLIWDPRRSDRLYVLTGRGETFSEGFLHVVDPLTYADLSPPLRVGINGADMVMLGARMLVASRSAKRLELVDLDAWRVLDELPLNFAPIGVAQTAENEAVVVSATSGDVVSVTTQGDRLTVLSRLDLGTFAFGVVSNQAEGFVYVIQPMRGIVRLDSRKLSAHPQSLALFGEPSRGALVWDEYLLVPARDGYLHFVDRSTNAVTTLDVAVVLGLDRSSLPVRGIDPGTAIDVGGGRFALINGRERSVLFARDAAASPPVRKVALLPSGAFGAYDAYADALYVTQPSINAITKVALSAVAQGLDVFGVRSTVGSELAATVILEKDPATVVAVDSTGRMMILNEHAEVVNEFLPSRDENWRAPLTTAPNGGFTAVKWSRQAGFRLVHLDSGGAVVSEHPIAISAVFSASEVDGSVVLVSRLTKELQFIDLSAGTSVTMGLNRDRPRAAVRLGSGSWAIIHDTTPDIGITLARIGQEESFTPYDYWYSAITRTPDGGALVASFNGAITSLRPSGAISRRRFLPFEGLLQVHPGGSETVWVTSENEGRAYRLSAVEPTQADARYEEAGLRSLAQFSGTSSLLATSTRRLEYLEEQD